jgi:hypothetical protein
MAFNEVYPGQPRFKALFVGVTTVKSGDPVRVGLYNGFAQYDSDGGVAAGRAPLYPRGLTNGAAGGKYNVPNWTVAMISGASRANVVFTAARNQGDPIYITPAGTLTDVATSNFLFGALDGVVAGAGTFSVVVDVICQVA